MTKKMIFYFHGYGSSPNTDKVKRLKEHFDANLVFAFPIDIDPKKSLVELEKNITNALIENIQHDDVKIVFVGTSLGAWYAGYMAEMYNVHAVLINPAYSYSQGTLSKVESFSREEQEEYAKIGFRFPERMTKFFISENDEVIDFSRFEELYPDANVTWVPNTTHRFNGPEFENEVIDYIVKL